MHRGKNHTAVTSHHQGAKVHALRPRWRGMLLCVPLSAWLVAGNTAWAEKTNGPEAKTEFEYDGDFLTNLSGGLERGSAYDGYLKLGETVGFGSWQDPDDKDNYKREFAIHASVIYPHGEEFSQKYVGDVNGVSNLYVSPSLRLFSLWAEGNFIQYSLSVRCGIWALDKSNGFWQSDGAGIFLNGGFGTFPVISNGLVAAVYPVSAPCIRVDWAPMDKQPLTLRAAVFSGDVGTPADNPHNTKWDLPSAEGAAFFLEAIYKLKSAHGEPVGTYKIGGYYDSMLFDDLSGGSQHRGNQGLYAVVDQYIQPLIAGAPAGLAAFAKVAGAPGDRNLVNFSTEVGLSQTGLFFKDEGRQDVIALGAGRLNVSDEARDSSGNAFPTHCETVIEMTYQAHLTKLERIDGVAVLLQPDLQYIINPGAVHGQPNALVAGLRFTVKY